MLGVDFFILFVELVCSATYTNVYTTKKIYVAQQDVQVVTSQKQVNSWRSVENYIFSTKGYATRIQKYELVTKES